MQLWYFHLYLLLDTKFFDAQVLTVLILIQGKPPRLQPALHPSPASQAWLEFPQLSF